MKTLLEQKQQLEKELRQLRLLREFTSETVQSKLSEQKGVQDCIFASKQLEKQFDPLYKDLQGNDPDFHLMLVDENPEVFEEEDDG